MRMPEIPRRNRIDLYVPAETAIRAASLAVEEMPADVRLTDAVILLGMAKDKVADFVDGIEPEPECPTCGRGLRGSFPTCIDCQLVEALKTGDQVEQLQQELADLRATHERLRDAAETLVNRLAWIHEDRHYKAVWESYMIHGGRYEGPKYSDEFEALKAALIPADGAQEPTP